MPDKLIVIPLVGIPPLYIEVVLLVMHGANHIEHVLVKKVEP